MELIEILRALNQAHGPSGDEGEIREKIAELARPFADELTVDTMGSLIVHKKPPGDVCRPHGLHRLYRHPH